MVARVGSHGAAGVPAFRSGLSAIGELVIRCSCVTFASAYDGADGNEGQGG